MRLNLRARCAGYLFLGLLAAGSLGLPMAYAQSAAQSAQPDHAISQPDKMDSPETNSEVERFRHAAPVQKIARMMHMSTETTAKIFEDLNSAILIGLILWFLLKMMPKMLRNRSETLQKQLMEARVATAQAADRLSAVEERLSKLGIEIEAIRQQTENDAAGDEKHIQEALEEERKRIVASAEQEISAAGAAARRELKKFAAELAVDRALGRIHLSAEDDSKLIRSFAEGLKGERN